ncbi:ABC transporter substrate-binding protein [Pseudactinotalea sp.]|uniref:ABC transporter substrate-binding protein n=1 Tax=Pseudactinotalea sp. TaxID=1926260 RepID=UPI003B3A995E
MRTRRILMAVLASAASAALLAACNSPAAPNSVGDQGEGLTPITFRLDWIYGAQHAGYVVADELGYYDDAGFDVTIQEGEGSAVTAQIVASGQADIGVISAGEVLSAVSNGLSLRAVATVVQQSPTAVLYDADRIQLDSLDDLYGLRLGVVTESSQYKEWTAVASLNDLDTSAITEVAGGQAVLQAFINGDLDAALGWTFLDATVAQAQGINVEHLLLSDFGLTIPNSALVANVGVLEGNPGAVTRFIEATERGWDYVREHPEDALDIFFDAAPEAEVESNTVRLPIFLEHLGDDFGAFRHEEWQALHDLYAAEGLLNEEIELEGQAYDSTLLP